jgi:Tfp pilus assembly protein PilP
MRAILPTVVFALLATAGQGQTPAPGEPQATPAPSQPPSAVESYEYDRDGRRDPFLDLLAGISATGLPAESLDGVRGLMTMELSVRGVLFSQGAYVAMVQAPNDRTYTVRDGDTLADGQIKSVTAEGLLILQDVNDPLSLVKQREVYRRLRSLEDPN